MPKMQKNLGLQLAIIFNRNSILLLAYFRKWTLNKLKINYKESGVCCIMLTDLGDFQLPSSSRGYNANLNKCCYGFLYIINKIVSL